MKRYAVLTLGGLILGLAIGFGIGQRSFSVGLEEFSDILALGEYETLASLQYREANPSQAKQALLDVLKFMDAMEANNRRVIQKQIDLDRGVAWMRVAILEEKAGNTLEAKKYARLARASLRGDDGNDMSEDRLRDLVTKFDSTPTYKLPGVYLLSRTM